ncbi:MAG: hypothetical protein UY03_C0017G0034 [Parcubacteria group bacterium GW2011_GWA2_47_64]|nr:MAG: hypothetical protein UY03_C0017G0034 [Parcubacteria group bacterium GW2011_GWA2_47_64]KKU96834.1 MAG: hypothetical protein UY29_C0006G0043 [Parcubacteria group bacterium GW2011_GWC2_48_17]
MAKKLPLGSKNTAAESLKPSLEFGFQVSYFSKSGVDPKQVGFDFSNFVIALL